MVITLREGGETAGFHGVEGTLFLHDAPWASDNAARASLLSDIGDMTARGHILAARLAATTLDPRTVRAAWAAHRWALRGRMDGQECFASQTSILEWRATLDAMDTDLGENGYYSAPIREALGVALRAAAVGPRYGEPKIEARVAPDQLHIPLVIDGPDRVWDQVDREALARGIDQSFARIERDSPAIARAEGR
jgi:hypothetical protein